MKKNWSTVTGKVINVENINVDTLFGHGALKLKHKLALNVDSFERGALMSKLKLELNVNTFEFGRINVQIAAPGRVKEGDRSGQVKLG